LCTKPPQVRSALPQCVQDCVESGVEPVAIGLGARHQRKTLKQEQQHLGLRARSPGSYASLSVTLSIGITVGPTGRRLLPHRTAARRGPMLGGMAIQRMDNVAIVVDDLDAAVAFFAELGMELEGKGQVEGLWADRTVGLDGVRSEIAMMRTPDGHSKLELTRYHTPAAAGAGPEDPPPNTLGLHRVMFAVDDIHDTVARLRGHGAELLGEVAQFESLFLLCYLRGPAGIIVALAEQIG